MQEQTEEALVRPDDAGSAKALSSSKNKRHKVDTQPANVRQSIDKTVRSREEAAFKGVLQFSERKLLVLRLVPRLVRMRRIHKCYRTSNR